nr:hypothetical protein [Tanacetum cinerariifolium]
MAHLVAQRHAGLLGQHQRPQAQAGRRQLGQQQAQQRHGVRVTGGGREAIGQYDGYVASSGRLPGQRRAGSVAELPAQVGALEVFGAGSSAAAHQRG